MLFAIIWPMVAMILLGFLWIGDQYLRENQAGSVLSHWFGSLGETAGRFHQMFSRALISTVVLMISTIFLVASFKVLISPELIAPQTQNTAFD